MIRISLFESPEEFYHKLDELDYETSYSVVERMETQAQTKTVYTMVENLDFDELCKYIETRMEFYRFSAYKVDEHTVFVEIEIA